MSDKPDEPKPVADEDWKEKVRAEREAARGAAERQPASTEPGSDEGAANQRDAGQVPPASFAILVTTLAAQAMTAMGHAPDPATGHPVVRPDVARHFVDTLEMLELKTKGNLTPQESTMLSGILHELRMLYVTTRTQPAPEPPQDSA